MKKTGPYKTRKSKDYLYGKMKKPKTPFWKKAFKVVKKHPVISALGITTAIGIPLKAGALWGTYELGKKAGRKERNGKK